MGNDQLPAAKYVKQRSYLNVHTGSGYPRQQRHHRHTVDLDNLSGAKHEWPDVSVKLLCSGGIEWQ